MLMSDQEYESLLAEISATEDLMCKIKEENVMEQIIELTGLENKLSSLKDKLAHEEKLRWLAIWCARNGLCLALEGTVGWGRECVGVVDPECNAFPDYMWFNNDFSNYKRLDDNGEVWVPEDAYHKHPCVAVLGRGRKAEEQLYEWIKWFEKNGFVLEVGVVSEEEIEHMDAIDICMRKHLYARFVKVK